MSKMADLDAEVQNFTAELVDVIIAARKCGVPQSMIADVLHKESDIVRCPCCGQILRRSNDQRRYETMIEHVENPNGESPERNYLYCPNEAECALRKDRAFFDFHGGIFTLSQEAINWCAHNHAR